MWVGTEARSGATGGVKYIGQIQPWSEFARWPWPRYSQELLTLGSAWKGLCWYFTSGVSVYPEHYYKISKEALNLNPWCGSHSFCFLLPSGSQWWRAELGSPAERCTLLPRSEYLCSLLQERMCHVSRRGWVGGGGGVGQRYLVTTPLFCSLIIIILADWMFPLYQTVSWAKVFAYIISLNDHNWMKSLQTTSTPLNYAHFKDAKNEGHGCQENWRRPLMFDHRPKPHLLYQSGYKPLASTASTSFLYSCIFLIRVFHTGNLKTVQHMIEKKKNNIQPKINSLSILKYLFFCFFFF